MRHGPGFPERWGAGSLAGSRGGQVAVRMSSVPFPSRCDSAPPTRQARRRGADSAHTRAGSQARDRQPHGSDRASPSDGTCARPGPLREGSTQSHPLRRVGKQDARKANVDGQEPSGFGASWPRSVTWPVLTGEASDRGATRTRWPRGFSSHTHTCTHTRVHPPPLRTLQHPPCPREEDDSHGHSPAGPAPPPPLPCPLARAPSSPAQRL